MRRLAILALSLLAATYGYCKGAQQSLGAYDYSKGLDSYHSSLSLQDGFVQDALNVYFDKSAPVEKRKGFTVAFTSSTFAYQSAWSYTDQTNTSWIIIRSSGLILASNLSGSVVKIATTSANDLVGEVNAFGNAYFVDPTQGVYYWNGTATTFVSGSPKGSLITQFHGRIWIAGAAVPNGNQLYGSKYLDGTTWLIGLNPNDPVQLTVGLQDNYDNIAALYPYLDTLYIFKHYSTSAFYGFDQTNFQISFITAQCGSIDQQSIQTFNGGLVLASLRGVELFDGYNCNRISDPVKNKVDPAIQAQSGVSINSWVQQTSTDWAAGTFSSTTISGQTVIMSTDNVNLPNNSFDSTVGGNCFNGLNNWGLNQWALRPCGPNTVVTDNCGTWAAQDGSLFVANSGGGSNFSVVASVIDAVSSTTLASVSLPYANNSCTWTLSPAISSAGNIGKLVRLHFDFGPNLTLSHDLISDPFTWGGNITFYYRSDKSTPNSLFWFGVDDVLNGSSNITQAVFTSQSHSISGATNFGNFSTNQDTSGDKGSVAYAICTSANSNMAPKTCSAQPSNSQITIATNTFVQAIATFTVTSSSLQVSAILQSFTVQWFTGSRSPSMASTVWDNRYLLSLTTSTADTSNDAILVLSPQNQWTVFNIHAAGLTQFKNNLYHSDSNATGNVYLDDQGYADNGLAINAYIKTKDYTMGDLTQDDFIDSIWPSMDNLGSYNVSVNYFVDRAATAYPLGTINQNEFAASASVKLPFPIDSAHQDFGKTLSYQFIASDLNEPWKFYGFREIFHSRPTQ